MRDLMSKRLRSHFREHSAKISHREIETVWQDQGFTAANVTSQDQSVRRARWRAFEASVDWTEPDEVGRVASVIETLLLRDTDEEVSRHRKVMELDGWTIDAKRRVRRLADTSTLSGLAGLRDPGGILDALNRAVELLESNPAGCVGAAKDLVEATAKSVLEHTESGWTENEKYPALIARAQKALRLHPSAVELSKRGAEATKQILGGLTAVAIGIDQLRNSEGSGHGRTTTPRLTPRHARLALNAARTWCELVLDTLADPSAPWKQDVAA